MEKEDARYQTLAGGWAGIRPALRGRNRGDVRGRSYAPAGKTPVAMAVGGTRQKLST